MAFRLSLVQFFCLLLLAIVLIPAGAHVAALGNKMALSPEDYMIAQKIYAGWAWFGVPVIGALVFSAWHVWLLRRTGFAFFLATGAFIALMGSHATFWLWTYPMNVATRHWTAMPSPFEVTRLQWEYSHASAAAATFAAFVLTIFAVFATRPVTDAAVAPEPRGEGWSGRVPN